MEPNKTLIEMLQGLVDKDYDLVMVNGGNLLKWLEQGGSWPVVGKGIRTYAQQVRDAKTATFTIEEG